MADSTQKDSSAHIDVSVPKDQKGTVTVENATNKENNPTTEVTNHDNPANGSGVERRKNPSAPIVNVNSPVTPASIIPGIWGIATNVSAVTFVMGMFYLMFNSTMKTSEQSIAFVREEAKLSRDIMREEIRAMTTANANMREDMKSLRDEIRLTRELDSSNTKLFIVTVESNTAANRELLTEVRKLVNKKVNCDE